MAAALFGFANEVADALERSAGNQVDNAFAAVSAMIHAYARVVSRCTEAGSINPKSVRSGDLLASLTAEANLAALGYVDAYVAEIMAMALGKELHRDYASLASSIALADRDPALDSVEKMQDHFLRIGKLGEAIRDCCEGDECAPSGGGVGELGVLDVMQTFGEGLYLRLWTQRPYDELSLWTPLGSVTVHQCSLSNRSYAKLVDRFALKPNTPNRSIPAWGSCDTLQAIGRDADGVSLPQPRQCTAVESLPGFLAQTIWSAIQTA